MPALPRITKKIFLATKTCQRKGWLLRNRTVIAELTLGEQFRIEQGIEIGERARKLYPEGILIEEKTTEHAARRTQEHLTDPSARILFEATFLHNDYAAKADVLIQDGDRWGLIEVKSKTAKARESKKDLSDMIDDMAYTTLIARKNGLAISAVNLMLLSEKFQLGMAPANLFERFAYTTEVNARVAEFEEMLDASARITAQPAPPDFRLTGDCKKCEFFSECVPACEGCSIFDIPRVTEKQLLELHAQGIMCIADIPDTFRLTDTQKKPVACMRSGKVIVDYRLARELRKVRWPAHYLDFETTQTAYPLYPDVTPYEKIPTQYSIHTCSSCGTVLSHKEYLADPVRDCRQELAESLIRDLDGTGSVVCYSSYEKRVIEGLIKRCPGRSGLLKAITGRLVDLIECSKCVSHPAFRGSNSIKLVLPALVPSMTYEGLPIANGEDALVMFAWMARGRFTPEECAQKREEMLRYCGQDTLAMVRIHEVFEGMAGGRD